MLDRLAEDIWQVDGPPVRYPAMEFPTRMVVVRLPSGDLWLHSPISLDENLKQALDDIGPIAALVAPNRFHHLYLDHWIAACPDARVYAAPGLREKRPDIAFDVELDDRPIDDWQGVIDHVVVTGNRILDEVVFLHRPSGVLVVTDLLLNIRTGDFPFPGRWFAKLDQVAFPAGGTPRLFRWTMKDRARMRRAIERVIDLRPRRIIIAHGESYGGDAVDVLRAKFAWLLK